VTFSFFTGRRADHLRSAFVTWLDRYAWTHFVSLATNDSSGSISEVRMRALLREWDSRLNRRILGPKWTQKPDERLFAAYFLEKPETNPHWHALVIGESEIFWKQLIGSGTVNVQPVNLKLGIASYITKEIGGMVQYNSFVVPRGFDPTAS
jgi:hypothetical protein